MDHMSSPVLDTISCWLCSISPCNLVQLFKCIIWCSLKAARFHCMVSLFSDDDRCRMRHTDTGNNGEEEEEEEEGEEEEERRQRKRQRRQHSHQDQHQQCIELHNGEKHDTAKVDDVITCEDIDTVVGSLGVDGWRMAQDQDQDLIREAHELLENKVATLEELKEAFYVFDRNEDGFITALELWSVLRRLEVKEEGRRYEDCEEMIRVYDKDGDGRISFGEFKHMMEQAL